MDKSSILEDAIKYLKNLEERVKKLEDMIAQKHAILVKNSQIFMEDEGSSDEINGGSLPDIHARVCNNHVLVKVHCDKQKGILVDLLSQIESLHMIVVSTNAIPFGNFSLDITIIAEMEEEFNLTARDVVAAVRSVLMPETENRYFSFY